MSLRLPGGETASGFFSGSGEVTTSDYGNVWNVSTVIRTGIGGKQMMIDSFFAKGFIVWTRGASNVHSYCGELPIWLELVDPDGNIVARLLKAEPIVIIDNVDEIRVKALIPSDRIADSTNPAYYHYRLMYGLSYKIVG